MDWSEKIATISINPDMATRDDVAKMAAECMELRSALRELHDFAERLKHYRLEKRSKKAFDRAANILKQVGE